MLRLVDDLLDIAKIESGKLELDLQPADLVTLVDRSVILNRVLAERKQIELYFASDDGIPTVMLDVSKIEQVLNNLINNAIKFSYPESTIQVCVARAEDRVVISVADQGQGIPADERETLFQPFVRTSVRSTQGEKSTGLGLAIVKSIASGHGGEIWVESEVGHGTTFYVALPVDRVAEPVLKARPGRGTPANVGDGQHDRARAQPAPAGTAESRPIWGDRHLRILVVDDNTGNRRLAVRMLERQGHMVEATDNGRQAIAVWRREPFDLILMDMYMPEMDGLEATTAIRDMEKAAGTYTPIVALTASRTGEDIARCRAVGMDACVSKPLQAQEFIDIAERLVPLPARAERPGIDHGDAMEAVE